MPFPHKTVLITGATAGIGYALAERMVQNGIFVIAVGRRKERLAGLVEKYGEDRIVAEEFDVANLGAIPAWTEKITKQYPSLSSIILNAGIQRTLDFTNPDYNDISAKALSEITTNYTSPLLTVTSFLPHLISLGSSPPPGLDAPPTPASVVLVTSGLALVPLPRCANYCAVKAALHSLAWSLRAQLASDPARRTAHIRVVEVIPPAVQTELHELQPELVAAGQAGIGMPLSDFIDETWAAMNRWDPVEHEIMVSQVRSRMGHVEDAKRAGFEQMLQSIPALVRPHKPM